MTILQIYNLRIFNSYIRKTGFTIIEVVVAIAILGIGVLVVAGFFAYSPKIMRIASHTSVATNLAQGTLDEEITKSFDELTEGVGTRSRYTLDTSSQLYIYQNQVNVNCVDMNLASVDCSVTPTPMKKIDVFVYWPEGTAEKNVQLTTLKTNK